MTLGGRVALATAALALFAGCGPFGASNRSTSPTPSTTSLTSTTPSPSPSPSPLACRIPVASVDAPVDGKAADGAKGKGGFVTFPGGTFSADAASLGSYDLRFSRWLPVFREWISPDGSHYSYPEYRRAPGPVTGLIHVVDVAGGADHAVTVPAPSTPIDYETEGVYVHQVVPNSGAPPSGLTRVDPATSSYRQISADLKTWLFIGGGSAWGIDPPPAPPGPPKDNRVIRLDLASGTTTAFAQRADAGLQLLGLDLSANPIIGATTNTNYLLLLGSTQLYSGALNDSSNPTGNVVADSHGVWVSSASGALWFYEPRTGLQKVATIPLPGFRIAGGCQ